LDLDSIKVKSIPTHPFLIDIHLAPTGTIFTSIDE